MKSETFRFIIIVYDYVIYFDPERLFTSMNGRNKHCYVCMHLTSCLAVQMIASRPNKYNYILNKNAFQWDAYRPLVDRIPACTVQAGCLPREGLPRGVSAREVSAWGECLPRGVCIPACNGADTPPCGQTDTRENITFANFVCGR